MSYLFPLHLALHTWLLLQSPSCLLFLWLPLGHYGLVAALLITEVITLVSFLIVVSLVVVLVLNITLVELKIAILKAVLIRLILFSIIILWLVFILRTRNEQESGSQIRIYEFTNLPIALHAYLVVLFYSLYLLCLGKIKSYRIRLYPLYLSML